MEYHDYIRSDSQISDEAFLDQVKMSNERMKRRIREVLIVYDEEDFFLGDNCILIYRLGLLHSYFGSEIGLSISFTNIKDRERYEGLAKNNPAFNRVLFADPDEIDLDGYDLLLLISCNEAPFVKKLKLLHEEKPISFAIMSLSNIVFARKNKRCPALFPDFVDIMAHIAKIQESAYRLYVSVEERKWADSWLQKRGVSPGDLLFIVIDNASHHTKMINRKVYQEVLLYLLSIKHSKILVFDEKGVNKRVFYLKWLGESYTDRLIFSERMSLRQDICLISSTYTKMVFGPCTGLLHCAAGVFNQLATTQPERPVLITYTGPWDAYFWWSRSPLVDCLVLRNVDGQKKISELKELDSGERHRFATRLDCAEYTSDMLIGYIDERLKSSSAMAGSE